MTQREASGSVEGGVNGAGPVGGRNPFVSAAEFLAAERQRIEPYIATQDGETIFFGPALDLIIAGPSDASKTLAEVDCCGKLANEGESFWLGLKVRGGLRVGMIL